MGAENSNADDRVVDFKTRRSGRGGNSSRAPQAPVEDLSRYEQAGDDADDYRHRMKVNLAAFAFIAALIGAGVWLADTMASMRKNQDCVLSGRRACTPVDVDRR